MKQKLSKVVIDIREHRALLAGTLLLVPLGRVYRFQQCLWYMTMYIDH